MPSVGSGTQGRLAKSAPQLFRRLQKAETKCVRVYQSARSEQSIASEQYRAGARNVESTLTRLVETGRIIVPYADQEKRANYERNRCPEASKARVEKHRLKGLRSYLLTMYTEEALTAKPEIMTWSRPKAKRIAEEKAIEYNKRVINNGWGPASLVINLTRYYVASMERAAMAELNNPKPIPKAKSERPQYV